MHNISRRRVLRDLGTASVTIGLSRVAQAQEIASEMEVREVDGYEQRKALARAWEDDGFRTLYYNYVYNGWDWNNIDAVHVTERDGQTRYVVMVELHNEDRTEKTTDQEGLYLIYNGIDSISTTAELKDVEPSKGFRVSSVTSTNENSNETFNIRVSTVENGEVVTTSSKVSASDLGFDQASASDIGGEGENDYSINHNHYHDGCEKDCEIPRTECEDWNVPCVLKTAGAYVTTIGACASCAGSAGWLVPACAVCVGAVLTSGYATISCNIGGGCTTQCVEGPTPCP